MIVAAEKMRAYVCACSCACVVPAGEVPDYAAPPPCAVAMVRCPRHSCRPPRSPSSSLLVAPPWSAQPTPPATPQLEWVSHQYLTTGCLPPSTCHWLVPRCSHSACHAKPSVVCAGPMAGAHALPISHMSLAHGRGTVPLLHPQVPATPLP